MSKHKLPKESKIISWLVFAFSCVIAASIGVLLAMNQQSNANRQEAYNTEANRSDKKAKDADSPRVSAIQFAIKASNQKYNQFTIKQGKYITAIDTNKRLMYMQTPALKQLRSGNFVVNYQNGIWLDPVAVEPSKAYNETQKDFQGYINDFISDQTSIHETINGDFVLTLVGNGYHGKMILNNHYRVKKITANNITCLTNAKCIPKEAVRVMNNHKD